MKLLNKLPNWLVDEILKDAKRLSLKGKKELLLWDWDKVFLHVWRTTNRYHRLNTGEWAKANY